MRDASWFAGALVLLVSACGGNNTEGTATVVEPQRDTSHWHGPSALERVHFPQVADNIKHDTLAVQITFDLLDGTHLMVAANAEETFEGLALYRYRARPDSSSEVLARSSPAYDSWTMFPTFFRAPDKSWPLVVFANFGEKQSWGQKLMLLDSNGFSDTGFLEVALPVRVNEQDSAYLKRESIAPFLRLFGDSLEFACDSLYIYDDGAGGRDRIVAARAARYVLGNGQPILYLEGLQVTAAPPDSPAL
ncbi:MAG: hypothetical protein IPJ76_14075 [Flavobacteriales bacterium]|nr:MAG: hypothetical protein IPJ76_14075 [Flavobacteriales bacterium]